MIMIMDRQLAQNEKILFLTLYFYSYCFVQILINYCSVRQNESKKQISNTLLSKFIKN